MSDFPSIRAAMLAELERTLNAVQPAQVAALEAALLDADRIFVAGKGRSGLPMQGFAMRLMHMGLRVYVVGDVTTPALTGSDLLLIGSGSGKTASLVNYATRASDLGAALALITIAPDSPIGRLAQVLVEIPASTPKLEGGELRSVQPMGSLFEQCLGLLLDALILRLMDARQINAAVMFARHANLE